MHVERQNARWSSTGGSASRRSRTGVYVLMEWRRAAAGRGGSSQTAGGRVWHEVGYWMATLDESRACRGRMAGSPHSPSPRGRAARARVRNGWA